eukprot:scaffold2004_cov101-Cylindrotheca_fusiformis.AAC.10
MARLQQQQQQQETDHDSSSRKVWNPETGRFLKINGPQWRTIMQKTGGCLAFHSKLIPINREALRDWEYESNDYEFSPHEKEVAYHPNTTVWHPLQPSEGKSDDELWWNDDNDQLPFLDQLLFVNKPSGLLTLPGIGKDKQICLATLVNDWLSEKGDDGLAVLNKAQSSAQRNNNNNKNSTKQRRKKKNTKPFVPRPCHRLDYDTSGVLVIALTRDSLRLTNAMFEANKEKDDENLLDDGFSTATIIQKSYIALVAGHVVQDEGTIDYPIGKIYNAQKDCNEFACLVNATVDKNDFVEKSLRSAKTQYCVLQRFTLPVGDGGFAKYTRIQLKPLTGRGHQLRLHMSCIGHPILGDTLHAPKSIAAATPRLCLHAESLKIRVRIDDEDRTCMVTASAIAPF